jgi:hypothetical protein
MSYLSGSSVIDSGFPTTTAAALATLTTGTAPGQHGMVGYSVLDPANNRVIKQLSGWDAKIDPYTWQPMPTVFERATELGHSAIVIGPERYRDSGFSKAVLRGALYEGASTIADRLERAAEWLAEPGTGIAYVYVPELDVAGHATGAESVEWTNWLEILDAAVRDFAATLGPEQVLLARAHNLATGRSRMSELPGVHDVSYYRDVRDLYAAADVLVTDYSSVMFDFAITGRPIVFYAYDLENYRDNLRGFYLPYDEATLPGPITQTQDELFDVLEASAALEGADERVLAFARTYAPHDDGQASARVVDQLL